MRAGRGEEASNGDGSTRGMVLEDDMDIVYCAMDEKT